MFLFVLAKLCKVDYLSSLEMFCAMKIACMCEKKTIVHVYIHLTFNFFQWDIMYSIINLKKKNQNNF